MVILFAILMMIVFVIALIRTRKIMLIHRFYITMAGILIVWLFALIGVRFTNPANESALWAWDAVMTFGGEFIPPCSLLFAICYTKEYETHLPKRYLWVFAIPLLTAVIVWTNPFHHLFYKTFALKNSEVEFGPYFPVYSLYTFACVLISVILIVRFALKTRNPLHMRQAILFSIGSVAPSIANLLAMARLIETNVAMTPLSFVVTMIFHGIVIYRLHFFDIKPLAMQQLVNWISDCYLVTSPTGLVINYNQPFTNLLGEQHGIRENTMLQECIRDEDVENKTAIFNLLTAIRSCQESSTRVTYEQTIHFQTDETATRLFYMVEVTPLLVQEEICGFLSIFKDITQIKVNMQKLQDSQVKMMERERLAFLGQMVGGLAHNLKTPIMSISGSVSAVENLLDECERSVGDEEVTDDDYREIYREAADWLQKMREACAYMSDIISAVKGQASNMNVSDGIDFSLEETLKRVALLLRHELLNNHCILNVENALTGYEILLHGDINNLVQVINNLVSNAVDAQKPDGNHSIIIGIDRDETALKITVKDFGTGVPPKIQKALFQQMVTSKGTLGTGLGVFISNTVIRAKFDGSMWMEENPEGGSIFGISIPMENVILSEKKEAINHAEK